MISDSLPCDNCGSNVTLSTLTCEYCSSSIGEKNPSKIILNEINKIDRLEIDFKYLKAIEIIKDSTYNNYELYKHRLARIELRNSIIGDDYIDGIIFLKSINTYTELIKKNKYYKEEAIIIIQSMLPNYLVRISENVYNSIKEVILKNKNFNQIIPVLQEQMVCEHLGKKAFKEYMYYTNPSNHMDDEFFKRKKDYIVNLYNKKLRLLKNE